MKTTVEDTVIVWNTDLTAYENGAEAFALLYSGRILKGTWWRLQGLSDVVAWAPIPRPVIRKIPEPATIEWIRLKDQRPPLGSRVLLWGAKGDAITVFGPVSQYDLNLPSWDNTHWAPMPNMPKKETA